MLLLLDEAGPPAAPPERDPYSQFRDHTRFWIQRVAVPLLMVIGLFGNSITVIIMTRRRMRSTTNMYLAALAFVDMLYLVLTFLLGLSHYPNMAGAEYALYWRSRPFLMMLTDACSNTSVWLTVTFTIERFIAVKYPMKGKVWCTEARAKMLIVCVFLFGVLFASPVPFEWRVVEKRIPIESLPSTISGGALSPATKAPVHHFVAGNSIEPLPAEAQDEPSVVGVKSINGIAENELAGTTTVPTSSISAAYRTVLALDYTEFGSNETFKTFYYGSTAVLFYFIPLFSLMLFNGFLIKSVHQSQRERTKMVRPSVSSTQCSQAKLESPQPASGGAELNGAEPGANRHLAIDRTTRGVPNEARGFLSTSFRGRRNKSLKVERNCMKPESHAAPPSLNPNSCAKVKLRNCLSSSQPAASSASASLLTPNSRRPTSGAAQDASAIIDLEELKKFTTDNSEVGEPAGSGVQIDCDIMLTEATGDREQEQHLMVANDGSTSLLELATTRTGPSSGHCWRPKIDPKHKSPPSRAPSEASTQAVKQTLSLKRSLLTNSSTRSILQHPAGSLAPVSSQERRITIMLIAVVILFLVCQIPSAAMLLYTSVRELEPNSKEEALVLAFGNIFNFLMAVNAAGDFILYSFLSKKYRKTFMILFCSCVKAHNTTGANKQSHYDTRRSIRFEGSSQQLVKKCSSTLQNSRSSDKSLKDTPL